ncbi:MAG TPA: S53 family peptidase [Puia sp.]|uniref:S53 family peptidase n=1 Tax=Puia sp. TaxID=2045100 RepID=UPI002CC1F612|nr:S53 family peptidase [Puia sp.]HVU95121.1 S53 family peptidase [Puia sp.]
MKSQTQEKTGGAPGGGAPILLEGSWRELRPGAQVLGVADPDEWLELTIKLRRKKALPEPGSGGGAKGVKVFSRADLQAQYGADPADIDKVRAVLTGLGMKILKEDAAACTVRAGGTVAVVESIFQVRLFHYSHPRGNYRGRKGNIHVPAELAGIILAVFGLDNRKMVKRRPLRRRTASLTLARRAAANRSWFYPAELATIYSFPSGDGSGQTVGLLEFGGGFFADDLAAFCQNANVAVPKVNLVSVNNTPTNRRDGAEGEVMLDVEVVAGVCPKATIVVYFSTFDEVGWVSAVDTAIHDEQNPISVLSISWGYAEDAPGAWTDGALDAINDSLKAAALLGVTICVAAGDDGSDDEVGDGHAHVDFPSSSPYVLAVGGTTLKRSAAGVITETAWKDGDGLRKDNGGSTGGGVSTYFDRPSWQTVTIDAVNPGSIEGRIVPDVAADASANTGYWMVVDGQGGASGGTSASAPLWASLIALLNASLGKPVGYLNPLLYQAGADGKTLGQSGCRDIISGNNFTASIGGYFAGPGYDAVTGWGVPVGTALLNGLK